MSNSIGVMGEDYTARWLENQGFNIIKRNFHSRYGEIDIIAKNSQYIIFVEVKTRREGSMVSPLEAVTAKKQKKILLTAYIYLEESPCDLQPRFDLSAVTTRYGKPFGLQYIENAFGE